MPRVTNPSVLLPAGAEIFHGSIEPIQGRLRPGGDQVLWFADDPKIAQLYIPRAGSSMITGADNLRWPDQDPKIRMIQHMLGIDYDLDAVEWDERGRPKSWPLPVGWTDMPTRQQIDQRIRDLGYAPYHGGIYPSYQFYFDIDGSVLPPGGAVKGELFVVAPTQDLRIADITDLGGDLTNPAHLWTSLFRQLEDLGYDGVVINDYAQSEEWGNLGHRSLGIFSHALGELELVDRVPATYEEFTFDGVGTRAWPHADATDFGDLAVDPTSGVDPAVLEHLTHV